MKNYCSDCGEYISQANAEATGGLCACCYRKSFEPVSINADLLEALEDALILLLQTNIFAEKPHHKTKIENAINKANRLDFN